MAEKRTFSCGTNAGNLEPARPPHLTYLGSQSDRKSFHFIISAHRFSQVISKIQYKAPVRSKLQRDSSDLVNRYQKWMVIQSLRLLPVLMVGVYQVLFKWHWKISRKTLTPQVFFIIKMQGAAGLSDWLPSSLLWCSGLQYNNVHRS